MQVRQCPDKLHKSKTLLRHTFAASTSKCCQNWRTSGDKYFTFSCKRAYHLVRSKRYPWPEMVRGSSGPGAILGLKLKALSYSRTRLPTFKKCYNFPWFGARWLSLSGFGCGDTVYQSHLSNTWRVETEAMVERVETRVGRRRHR